MTYSQVSDPVHVSAKTTKQQWFDSREWLGNFHADPDITIDVNAFYDHYHRHPALWEKVFAYLEESDPEQLVKGKYSLAGDSLYVIVDEYRTEYIEKRDFEAHRRYIDLQYVISGQETIGVSPLKDYEVLKPYVEETDIAFYEMEGGVYRHADERVFFIFFPGDAHKPCISVDQSIPVKKIVFKILADL